MTEMYDLLSLGRGVWQWEDLSVILQIP